jgi:quercetin dioxygenase-like cupin family protein
VNIVERRAAIAVTVAVLAAAGMVFAQAGALKLVEVVPADLKFTPSPNGTFQAVVVGDSTKVGMYAMRTRIPSGLRIQPHFHPDDRIVLVLSGTLYVGFGERLDEARMTPLPAGSVFTEPGKQAHFTWAKEGDVLLHVVGNGPTGATQVPATR